MTDLAQRLARLIHVHPDRERIAADIAGGGTVRITPEDDGHLAYAVERSGHAVTFARADALLDRVELVGYRRELVH